MPASGRADSRRSARRIAVLALACALGVALLAPGSAERAALAQEPLPTFVVTTPTPTRVPLPTPTPHPLPGYVVQDGDTLITVALEMGIDVDEMGCLIAPDFDPTRPLVIGDRLEPLPDGAICYRTVAGDTPRSVTAPMGLAPESILQEPWNELGSAPDLPLPAGRYVRIPVDGDSAFEHVMLVTAADQLPPLLRIMLQRPANSLPQAVLGRGGPRRSTAMAPIPADWPYGSGRFLWPAYGILTQGYRLDHRALDIAAPTGSPVTASDRGVVIRAGWNNQGYGNFVIVDHKIDYLTLYGHLDQIFVREGDVVAQGQILGTVGNTGNSTGPHLHFEIRDFGRLTNPLELLAQ